MLQTSFIIYMVNFRTFFPPQSLNIVFHVFSVSLRSDMLSLAVDIEHDVFKSSKSSNLYKAAVLKKVTADCSACHSTQKICSYNSHLVLKRYQRWRRRHLVEWEMVCRLTAAVNLEKMSQKSKRKHPPLPLLPHFLRSCRGSHLHLRSTR